MIRKKMVCILQGQSDVLELDESYIIVKSVRYEDLYYIELNDISGLDYMEISKEMLDNWFLSYNEWLALEREKQIKSILDD
jgi:hypothetical protein